MEIVKYKVLDNDLISFSVPFSSMYKFEQICRLKDGTFAFQEYEITYGTYEVNFHIIRLVSKLLKSLGLEVDSSELSKHYGKPKFEEIGQSYLRDEQYEYMKRVMCYFSGLLTLPTGFGKNTMMVYMIQASLKYQKNILIMAPKYSIIDEIMSRCAQYGINPSKEYDVNNHIWAVNPVGLVNSKRLQIPEIVQWLQDCTMLIMDECQEVNNSQERLLNEYLPNCLTRFGLSATSDKYLGLNLTNLQSLNKLDYETFKILKYFGPAIVYKAPQRRIRVVDTIIPFGDYKNLWSYDKCINRVCHSKYMPMYIARCIEDNNREERSTILFPFTNRAHVEYLLSDLYLMKYNIIMWTASGVRFNNGKPEEKGAGLNRVKELINRKEVDLALCTSVAFKGVSIDGFRSVMFMTSSSYGMITQILGRAFRYKGKGLVNVYIARNVGDNPLYNASYWKRRKMILQNNEHIIEVKNLIELKEKDDDLFSE